INSVTALAGGFGSAVLGLTIGDLILTILVIQFVAAPAAIGFTKLAEIWSTKKALQFSLVCWCFVIVGALSFAPLSPDNHDDFGLHLEWNENENYYEIEAHSNPELAQEVGNDEQIWAADFSNILPLEINKFVKDGTVYEWSDNKVTSDNITSIESLLASIEETRFTMSIEGGVLDGETVVGEKHTSSLGEGLLDFIPEKTRDWIWAPLGISVTIQFLILGVMAGILLGGSQGLSRSLFGQMVPETRSAEFFGFFGFFGKVAALIGPLLYFVMGILFDSRVAIFSISLLIIAGAIILRKVDVEDGIAVAKAEDERNRSASHE
ncbi:MAG: hypothetical protein HOM85_02770, partial [Euryarchaeota archaeon]|nr:hypothetical protein [Euryarchaeota archaeon]